MNLLEHQGKELFKKYGISVPKSVLIKAGAELPLGTFGSGSVAPEFPGFHGFPLPLFLKSQVATGNRKQYGGIIEVQSEKDLEKTIKKLFKTPIDGFLPKELLAEEKISFNQKIYVSLSYDTEKRAPVLSLSKKGGTGIEKAFIFLVDLIASENGLSDLFVNECLKAAGLPQEKNIKIVVQKLWTLFKTEHALVAEINPLFVQNDGSCIAIDSKVSLDDNFSNPSARTFLNLQGDVAIIASGGGASMLNIDTLLRAGGKPANYAEYSGNPPAHVVKELTKQILSKPGLKGCWVVGGTANFTDIYETMSGFIEGLREIKPKPSFPIVIRRDGPRREEAFALLKKTAEKEGYNFSLFGPETSMADSAHYLMKRIK